MTLCNCEHKSHFPDMDGTGHAYMGVDASPGQRAWFVGEICDACATTCLADSGLLLTYLYTIKCDGNQIDIYLEVASSCPTCQSTFTVARVDQVTPDRAAR